MKWRYHMETDWYGGMPPAEQRVVDGLEHVNEAYWSHPDVRRYQRAVEMGSQPPAALVRRYRELSEVFHAAKQMAAEAAPNFPLSWIILAQRYPRPLASDCSDPTTTAAALERIAHDMTKGRPPC